MSDVFSRVQKTISESEQITADTTETPDAAIERVLTEFNAALVDLASEAYVYNQYFEAYQYENRYDVNSIKSRIKEKVVEAYNEQL